MNSPVLGEAGGAVLREGLAAADNPLRFVEQFQRENSLSPAYAQDCLPVLKLLDTTGLTRHQFLAPLVARLCSELVQSVRDADPETLARLADATFPFISIVELRPAALAVLEAMHPVPDLFLRQLASTPELYAACPLGVRQQVWRAVPSTLASELAPVLAEYATDPAAAGLWPPSLARRERRPAAARRVAALASSHEAHSLVAEHLRAVYAATGDAHAAALRCDVLMELHDADADVSDDVAHELIWCLDACGRDAALSPARVREFRTAEAHTPPHAAALAAANPRTVSVALHNAFIAAMSAKTATSTGTTADLEDVLTTACHIVCLADQARELAAKPTQQQEPRRDAGAALASFIRCIVAGAPLDSLSTAVHCSRVCRRALLFRTVVVAAEQHPTAAGLLGFVAGLDDTELAEEPTFARSLVSVALESKQQSLPQLVLDCLMPHCSVNVVREPLLRLVSGANARIAQTDLPRAVELLVEASVAASTAADEVHSVEAMISSVQDKLTPDSVQRLLAQLHSRQFAPVGSFAELANVAAAAAEAQQIAAAMATSATTTTTTNTTTTTTTTMTTMTEPKKPATPPPPSLDDDDM